MNKISTNQLVWYDIFVCFNLITAHSGLFFTYINQASADKTIALFHMLSYPVRWVRPCTAENNMVQGIDELFVFGEDFKAIPDILEGDEDIERVGQT